MESKSLILFTKTCTKVGYGHQQVPNLESQNQLAVFYFPYTELKLIPPVCFSSRKL